MKKNGFIATSLIYSFFLVFVAVIAAIINSYIANKTILDRYNEDIEEKFNNDSYSVNLNVKNAGRIINGITMTNLLEDGSFSNATKNSCLAEINKYEWYECNYFGDVFESTSYIDRANVIKQDVNGFSYINDYYLRQLIDVNNDDKYYYSVDYIKNFAYGIKFGFENKWSDIIEEASNWSQFSEIYESTSTDSIEFQVGRVSLPSGTTSGVGYYSNAIIINVTESFGKGNEPAKEWLDKNIKWFDDTIIFLKGDNIKKGEDFIVNIVPSVWHDRSAANPIKITCNGNEYSLVDINWNEANTEYTITFKDIEENLFCDIDFTLLEGTL